ncbi:lipopolysaccharide biosynthesis protein [Actinocorallia lasiicapitis]
MGTGPQDISSLLGAKPRHDASRMDRLRGELGNPLFRNAYALMLNGGLTGVLGLGFWIAAKHFHTQEDFGRSAAEIQAIMGIGGVTILNYMLLRFVPLAGPATKRLVVATYLVGAVSALLLGVLFLVSLNWWSSPNFDGLTSPGSAALFLLFIVAWNIFTQQDGVFTGLRRAGWVPAKNTGYGVLKFVLLAALAWTIDPASGIVLATMIPVLLVVVPMDVKIFRTLIPEHVALTKGRHRTPTPREVGRYLAGDYIGTVFSHSTINFIPLLVAAKVSAGTNGYFAMAWVFGLMLDLLALNMAMSMTVEGSFDTAKLAETTKAALRRTVMLLVPISAFVAFVAPWVLSWPILFGAGFAGQAGPVLMLLAFATLPKAVIELYIGVLRVRSKTRLVALIQGARFAGVLAGVLLFVDDHRLIAVGWAVLAVQGTVALAVLPPLLRATRTAPVPSQSRAAEGRS